jgi:hypothetical protein
VVVYLKISLLGQRGWTLGSRIGAQPPMRTAPRRELGCHQTGSREKSLNPVSVSIRPIPLNARGRATSAENDGYSRESSPKRTSRGFYEQSEDSNCFIRVVKKTKFSPGHFDSRSRGSDLGRARKSRGNLFLKSKRERVYYGAIFMDSCSTIVGFSPSVEHRGLVSSQPKGGLL